MDNDEIRILTSASDVAKIVQNVQGLLDEIKQSSYAILFDRLGVPKNDFPDFSNTDTVMSALLDALGTDEHRLDLVLSIPISQRSSYSRQPRRTLKQSSICLK